MLISKNLYQFTLDARLSTDPDGNALSYKWNCSSNKIQIQNSDSSKAIFMVPLPSTPFNADITLEVSDGKLSTFSTQTIGISDQSQSYGLGQVLSTVKNSNTSYNWYYDQGNSGEYSLVNCGPTSVTMSIKWAKPDFKKTPEDARQAYRSTGGWWYTSDIINYLNDNSVNNYTIALTDINQLKDKIDGGNILILCLDMYYVDKENSDTFHVDKFYNTNAQGWGHFIVIKGYVEVDGQTFFEAYDPYSFGVTYTDNSLKGKDRYYKAENLNTATNNWWDYAIVITQPVSNGRLGADGRLAIDPNKVDPSSIEHKSGR